MELPAAPQALFGLAEFVLGLLRSGSSDDAPRSLPVVVAPPAPFAANGYARARLLRQLHLSGALTRGAADTFETAG
jgi:hypothetical protein